MNQEIILQIVSLIIDALKVPHIAVLAGMLGIGVPLLLLVKSCIDRPFRNEEIERRSVVVDELVNHKGHFRQIRF